MKDPRLSIMNKDPHFVDSHAHLTNQSVGSILDQVLSRAVAANVKTIINICTGPENLAKAMELTSQSPKIYHTAAVHPHDVEKDGEGFFPIVKRYAEEGKLVAIGETGLDYFYTHSPRETQQHYLRKHFHLSKTCHLPVIIHCREAFADFFNILDEEYVWDGKHGPGVLHCFTGTLADAQEVIKRGWYISFSGIITFKKSEELREIVQQVPLDRILIETDSPFLAPQSHRGKPNEPSYLPEIAETIAKVKQTSVEEIMRKTAANTSLLFSL